MSLIACTSKCVYQRDGYCGLERALSCGLPNDDETCVNFVPRHSSDLSPLVIESPQALL